MKVENKKMIFLLFFLIQTESFKQKAFVKMFYCKYFENVNHSVDWKGMGQTCFSFLKAEDQIGQRG